VTRPDNETDATPGRSAAASSSRPESPADLTKRSWWYVTRKTFREFSKDQCTDLAAALTYYAVLAFFPAAIALLSLVSVFGQGRQIPQLSEGNHIDKVMLLDRSDNTIGHDG